MLVTFIKKAGYLKLGFFVLGAIWTCALVGAIAKLVLPSEAIPMWFSVGTYLFMGWFGLVGNKQSGTASDRTRYLPTDPAHPCPQSGVFGAGWHHILTGCDLLGVGSIAVQPFYLASACAIGFSIPLLEYHTLLFTN